MAETGKSKKAGGKKPGGSTPTGVWPFNAIIYGDKFQNWMNDLFSPAKIVTTVAQIKGLENTSPPNKPLGKPPLGNFQVGVFNRYLLPHFDWSLAPGARSFDDFERDFFLAIPAAKRQAVSDVLYANFHSANPLPVYFQTNTNLDPIGDAFVRGFVSSSGKTYLGVFYLCPNPNPPP
jgi:hypothetical protein